jgi:hypothetical protein
MTIENQLGVWGNESCVQCGVCCVDIPGCTSGLCLRQKIVDKRSYCSLHGPNKPEGCRKYFCSGYEPDQAEEIRQTAIRMGTAPTLRDLTPQQNH